MNEQEYNDLRATSWQRELTPAETADLQAFLAANPSAVQEWQADAELNHLLDRRATAPAVSSNFTAQVLAAVRREAAARERQSSSGWLAGWLQRSWLPKFAVATLAVVFSVVVYHQHEVNNRAVLARNVVALAEAVSANTQVIEDYDSIRQLSDSQPKADTELLALMK
jgi:hypothetical protein